MTKARRRAAGQIVAAGHDLRLSRQLVGMSIREASKATGISPSAWSRLELGRLQDITVARLAIAADTVGMQLGLKLYPGGDAVRDAAHLTLLERLRGRLHPALRWRTEVPLPGDRDLRAWDAVVAEPGKWIPVEAETRLTDVQALERRIHLKMRDGGADRVILLVAESRTNRRALRSTPEAWTAAFPIGTRVALHRLSAGRLPDASALIVL